MSDPFKDAKIRREMKHREKITENFTPIVVFAAVDDEFVEREELSETQKRFEWVKKEITRKGYELIQDRLLFMEVVDPSNSPYIEEVNLSEGELFDQKAVSGTIDYIERKYEKIVFWVRPHFSESIDYTCSHKNKIRKEITDIIDEIMFINASHYDTNVVQSDVVTEFDGE